MRARALPCDKSRWVCPDRRQEAEVRPRRWGGGETSFCTPTSNQPQTTSLTLSHSHPSSFAQALERAPPPRGRGNSAAKVVAWKWYDDDDDDDDEPDDRGWGRTTGETSGEGSPSSAVRVRN
jgi:hypothetical protein